MDNDIVLTADQEEQIKQCGAVGFTPDQVAIVFGFEPWQVHQQFDEKKGCIYQAYMQGRLQSELNIRQAVLKSAYNGSTPAQQQIEEYYRVADAFISE